MEKYKFRVKPEHLRLMQRFAIGWDDAEFGAPEVDPKRPYGDSDVYQDMLEILGLKKIKEGVFEFVLEGQKWLLKGEDKYNIYLDGKNEEKLKEKLRRLHEETQKALQICLLFLRFEVGFYTRNSPCDEWERVDD